MSSRAMTIQRKNDEPVIRLFKPMITQQQNEEVHFQSEVQYSIYHTQIKEIHCNCICISIYLYKHINC